MGALVADEYDEIVHEDGGGAHSIDVVERSQRHTPALPAASVVRDEPEVREEHVHVAVIGHR